MQPNIVFASTWAKLVTCYLMIGLATQLPGGLFRRYPAWWLIRQATRCMVPGPFWTFPSFGFRSPSYFGLSRSSVRASNSPQRLPA